MAYRLFLRAPQSQNLFIQRAGRYTWLVVLMPTTQMSLLRSRGAGGQYNGFPNMVLRLAKYEYLANSMDYLLLLLLLFLHRLT